MKLLAQPNRWSCLITSLAMVLDRPIAELTARLGHGGDAIWWPHLPEPLCRRGFSPAELLDLSAEYGYAMMEVPCEVYAGDETIGTKRVPFRHGGDEERISHYMRTFDGVIVGHYNALSGHAVAWDHKTQSVYDPYEPKVYKYWESEDFITIEMFFPIVRIELL